MDLNNVKKIKMVLFDVDGVMTDGTIYMSANGEEIKAFNVQDGLAIELLHSHGFITGVISGKASAALSARCNQLGFAEIITGCKNKLPKLNELCEKYGLTPTEIAFCGDDILDVPIFKCVGLAVAPINAHALALRNADWTMKSKGGDGMVREFADLLITTKFDCSLEEAYIPLLNKIEADSVSGIQQ